MVVLRVPASAAAWSVVAGAARSLTGTVRVVVLRFEPDDASRVQPHAQALQPVVPESASEQVVAAFSRPDLVWVAVLSEAADATVAALAVGCDLRVFSAGASIALSGATAFGGLAALSRLVGYARALELSLTARRMSAAEAHAAGVANLVVDAGQLDAAVADLVAAILATPRVVATETKALLSAGDGAGLQARVARDREATAAYRRLADDWSDGTGESAAPADGAPVSERRR